MPFALESMALEMPPLEHHPNRVEFRGVLTTVDKPSDRAPSGARGHRVILTRNAAERALPSLLGMGMDYTPTLDRHDAKQKVGIITRAEIVDKRLELAGYLFAKDFPEVVRAIRANGQGSGGALGMSYELADARVADLRAQIWVLTEVTFTGAAILRREKAAYRDTWIEMQ